MEEFLNTETHTRVLLMNHLWGPRLREVRNWVNTVLKLTSRKTEIAISAWEPKLQGVSCRRRAGTVVPRAGNLGDLITADHKVLSGGCESREQSPICSRGAGSSHPMDPGRIRAETKLQKKPRGARKSSWSRIGSLKSFTLTIPWNLANLAKIFPGIIVRQHLTVQKQRDCWDSSAQNQGRDICGAVANRVWTTNGGPMPWNVTAICETFKISCLMEKHHVRGGSGYHLTDQCYRLERW